MRTVLTLIFVSLPLSAVSYPYAGSIDNKMYEIAASVSAARLKSDVEKLVGFGTRHTLSETESSDTGIGAARRWIEAEFNEISEACGHCLEVFTISDMISGEPRIPDPTEIVSVIAIQRGQLDPGRYVMMTGDVDSRVSDPLDSESLSPGANDNASGMAGVLEAARVLSQYEFAGSIIYAGLSGEEQGLFGGKIVAAAFIERDMRLKAVLNNDMISNIGGINGVIDNITVRVFSEGTRAAETEDEARVRRFTGGEVDSASRNLARFVDIQADQYMPDLDVMMIYRLDRFGRGGHHRPFNEAGIPAVRIMETNEHYDRQHQDIRIEDGVRYGDTIEWVNYDYMRKITALNAIVLGSLASAPPFPADVKIAGAVRADTTLSWTVAEGEVAANLAGYKVYWRLTDQPQWQWSRSFDVTGEAVLQNIVIDNYFFGVASVANDGAESPVVFPGAVGSFGDWQ